MVDVARAFDVDNGIVINDGAAILSGSGDPTGTAAPMGTIYLATENIVWKKFGSGDSDWKKLSADDIVFDDTSVDFTAGDVQAAIESLSGAGFGKDFAVQEKTSSENTSGNSFDTYSTLTFNVSDSSGTNKYRLNADFYWGHNSASNDIRVRAMLDGVQVGVELRIEPKDTGNDQRIQNNILRYVSNLSAGNHTYEIQYRPASNSRVSRMYSSTIEAWRVL